MTRRTNPTIRWQEHKCDARNPKRNNKVLYRALNKYGIDNFKFEVIEETSEPEEREKYFIKKFNTFKDGYNQTLGGEGTPCIQLPEFEVCQYYQNCLSVRKTATFFKHDYDTIRNILLKNNIKLLSAIESTNYQHRKRVAQIDKDSGEIMRIYNSVIEAEKATKNCKHIEKVCNGKRKTAYGYKWQYV